MDEDHPRAEAQVPTAREAQAKVPGARVGCWGPLVGQQRIPQAVPLVDLGELHQDLLIPGREVEARQRGTGQIRHRRQREALRLLDRASE